VNVVLFPRSAGLVGLSPEYYAFCLARQTMNKRFVDWQRAYPNADIVGEVEITHDVLRQLQALEQTP